MNFILTRDKATTIPPAAMKLSGIPDNAKLELTTLDGAVILTKSKMTTMEYVKLLTALTAHVGQILLSLLPRIIVGDDSFLVLATCCLGHTVGADSAKDEELFIKF